jgi:hypothetical protein
MNLAAFMNNLEASRGNLMQILMGAETLIPQNECGCGVKHES